MFTACGGKKVEVQKLGEYDLIVQNDKFGLKWDGYTVLEPEYEKITEQDGYVLALSNGYTTLVSRGTVVLTEKIEEITPTEVADYSVIRVSDGVYLWKNGSSIARGKFDEVAVKTSETCGDFAFCRDSNGWGVINPNVSLAPRKYEKVYIAASSNKFAVLVYNKNDGWEIYNDQGVTEGRRYDTPPKVLERRLRGFNTSAPYGILKVDWTL
ncbi:MAG: hypothetical protein J6Y91_01870 [Alphaproteobacteria bacterium]|nr:hypothetical protein [Alphaproteobacteria bacterium]